MLFHSFLYFLSSLLLLVILSWWVFFSQHYSVVSPSTLLIVIFWVVFGFPHCPWVWPLTWIAAYIRTTFLSDHIVAIYPPLGGLLMDLSSTVAMTPSMATDVAVTPHLYPLFLLLADHPSKSFQDNYTKVLCWYRQKMVKPCGLR